MKCIKLSKLDLNPDANMKDENVETCSMCPFLAKTEYDETFCYLGTGIDFTDTANEIATFCPLPEAENEKA